METISHRGPCVSEQEAAGPIALTQTDGCQQGFLPVARCPLYFHTCIIFRFPRDSSFLHISVLGFPPGDLDSNLLTELRRD